MSLASPNGDPKYSSSSTATTAISVDESGNLTNKDAVETGEGAGSKFPPLPKGAMATSIPSLAFHPPAFAVSSSAHDHPDSPPTTPSQRLLDGEPSHVQFARYPETPDEKTRPLMEDDPIERNGWVPPPLRTWYWVSLVSLLVALAVALEVALHFTNKNQGWKTHGDASNVTGVMHYVYTLPPVIVAAVLVALWAWTDIEIKKMQPYVDLVHGDSPPHKSLLLDYTRTNNFVVWTRAAMNKHYLVALASLMLLLTLCFQPLASALLSVKNTWIAVPDITLNTISTVGLNQDPEFNDLTIFLTAAGYASASVGYNLQQPPFVLGQYTITPFQMPTSLATNGTVFANTTAVKSDTGCVSTPVTMVNHTDGSGWNNSISHNGCFLNFEVDHSATTLFGSDTPNCGDTTPPQFLPVVFWFFTYVPSAKSSATICYPAISLWDVHVSLDLASGNLTQVTELAPFSSASNFSSLSGNVTGAPLNGRAYNGIAFSLDNPDKFVIARANATQLTMPAAVYQAAVQSPQGLTGSFDADLFVNWSNQVYITYLTLIAKAVYFLPNAEPITLEVKTFQLRLWMSPTAVHLLAAAFLILAVFATIIHIFHRFDRQDLNLLHEPGTIASAVSIGAQTGMGDLLARQRNAQDLEQALHDKKFRIDPFSMKIMMDGEEGYETARSPVERRKSVFGGMQALRASRRFSRAPESPGQIPSTPRSAAGAV
ncbi:hypothetical protein B0H10DRAFT_1988625 [Mycena sp. CBHHK59/15]|nr:hypothetical protein B0H10DRAFT_1988625 [Mycena sp. CBHHK59/15]